VRWEVTPESLAALAGANNTPGSEDFTLSPTEGTILPGDSCGIRVTFHAREAKVLVQNFSIQVRP